MTGPIVYKGKTYPHLNALSDAEAVVANSTVDGRLKSGWPLEKALKTPAKKLPPANPITTYKGRSYPTFTALVEAESDLPSDTVRSRLRSGWPLEKALKARLSNQVTYKGKTYSSMKALIDNEGKASVKIVRGRLERGWPLEKALRTPSREITYKGTNYRNTKALIRDEGVVSVATTQSRLHKGWSLEDALNTPLENTSVTFKKRSYPTFTALVEAESDLTINTVRGRLSSGWPLEKALKTASDQVEYVGAETTYNEKTYPSFAAMVREEGDVSIDVVHQRLSKGWELDEALKTPKHPRVKRIFNVDGKTYESISALARAFKLPYTTVMSRVRQGHSDHEIAYGGRERNTNRKVKGHTIIVAGKTFPSAASAARQYGVAKSTFLKRLYKGNTPEQAAGLENIVPTAARKRGPQGRVIVNGQSFSSMGKAASHFGVPEWRVYYRRRQGATPEQALGIEPFSRFHIEYKGKSYKSKTAIADAHGINPSNFGRRLRSGWTLEEALELVDRPVSNLSKGQFNQKFFDRNPEEKRSAATLYFVKITHKESGQNFSKIGITTRTVEGRLAKNAGYTYKEITSRDTTLYDAWRLEQMILEDYADFGIIWQEIDFGGRTECFNFSDEQIAEIRQLIDEL